MNRLFISEKQIIQETGWEKATLDSKIYKKEFPKKVSSSRKLGRLFWAQDVYKHFEKVEEERDPFKDAIHG